MRGGEGRRRMVGMGVEGVKKNKEKRRDKDGNRTKSEEENERTDNWK